MRADAADAEHGHPGVADAALELVLGRPQGGVGLEEAQVVGPALAGGGVEVLAPVGGVLHQAARVQVVDGLAHVLGGEVGVVGAEVAVDGVQVAGAVQELEQPQHAAVGVLQRGQITAEAEVDRAVGNEVGDARLERGTCHEYPSGDWATEIMEIPVR